MARALSLRVGYVPAAYSFSDEFTGAANAAPNSANWIRETGQGYGQETYTTATDLAYLDGSSNLVLKAKLVGSVWNAAQLSTRTIFTMNSGSIEFRAQMPTTTGFWPGIWFDPSIHGEAGTTQAFGEFDILEMWNGEWAGNPAFTTLHYWVDRGGGTSEVHAQTQPAQSYVPGDGLWHVWNITWTSSSISISIDGAVQGSMTAAQFQTNTGHPWPFNNLPMYFIMQLAVDGGGSGSSYPPPPAGVTEAQMLVDYIRITKTA